MNPDAIRKEIASLPDDDPTACEGQIRRLHGDIQAVEDANEKRKLLHELEAVACHGLSTELKDMMKKKGLALEGLGLVLNYLTNLPELSEYLYSNEGKDKDVSLENIRKRIGTEIEVIGRLKVEGIDVTQEWVKKLCETFPSLRSLLRLSVIEKNRLCQGASTEELGIVTQLVTDTESKQLSLVPHDPKLAKENAEKKSVDEEKLKKAKELMNEAKSMATAQATENKKELKDKLGVLSKVLEMPPDWYKQDKISPDKLMQDLDGVIQQYSNVVESSESYNSDLEVVVRASKGRALCGIYHSEYNIPETVGLPILVVPRDVSIYDPGEGTETKYMRFSKQGAAANYVKTIASSSTNVGVAVVGFYGLFVGEAGGAYGSEKERTKTRTTKSSTTNVSVLQYKRTAVKAFQIKQNEMKLSMTARELAMSIGKSKNSSEDARSFMQRYGSHVPAGAHTLGGVFFSIADAESQNSMETSEFAKKAVYNLQTQISAGFLGGGFGIGGSVTGEHSNTSGIANGSRNEKETTSYTYSVTTIGPSASNPETFQKLLSYNSTWAIIDRGPPTGYIPVWELITKLGSDFKLAADILKQTWEEDEEKKKKAWEQRQVAEEEKRKKYEEQKEREAKLKTVKEELETTKKRHLEKDPGITKGHWPTNGKIVYNEDWLKHKVAYDKAIELIMKDPEHNICEITYWWKFGGGYTLKCWTALDDTPMTFGSGSGSHVLFFSEDCFKWKDLIPRRG